MERKRRSTMVPTQAPESSAAPLQGGAFDAPTTLYKPQFASTRKYTPPAQRPPMQAPTAQEENIPYADMHFKANRQEHFASQFNENDLPPIEPNILGYNEQEEEYDEEYDEYLEQELANERTKTVYFLINVIGTLLGMVLVFVLLAVILNITAWLKSDFADLFRYLYD